jgi:hypothetical protein
MSLPAKRSNRSRRRAIEVVVSMLRSHVDANGAEHRSKDRSSTAIPMLAVLHRVRASISVVRLSCVSICLMKASTLPSIRPRACRGRR